MALLFLGSPEARRSDAGSALAAKSTRDVSPHALGERGIYTQRATIKRIKPVGLLYCIQN
ncbi:MAG: hypothetical protein K0R37_323 [Arthrobacter sp.]|nr:hypothetical protein [Arthrobacter sp.]